jgi:imidazolonepropionase-like amidohydrolase
MFSENSLKPGSRLTPMSSHRRDSLKTILLVLVLCPVPELMHGQAFPLPRAAPLVFMHITVIDATGAPPKRDMTVVVAQGRIARIEASAGARVSKEARVVNGRGKYLIPGLWDMHVHIWETQLTFPLFLANGVTGVRNTGGHMDELKSWREAVASGKLLGPHMVICGPVVDGPPPVHPDHSIVVRNADEARQAVDLLKRSGMDFVKVYDNLSREAYFAIAAEAKQQKIPFVGHVPVTIIATEASAAGQASIEHLGNVIEDSSADPAAIAKHRAEKPKSPGDFPAHIAEGIRLELSTFSSDGASQIYSTFLRNNTWQVPTLEAKRVFASSDEPGFMTDSRLKYISRTEAGQWRNSPFFTFVTPSYIAARKALYRKELEVTGAMHGAKVRFLAGTDSGGVPFTFPGFNLHDELALLAETGFTPMEAIEAATSAPAKFLGLSGSLGTVEQGKIADLVVLDANPLEDIHNTKRIDAVVIGGRYLSRAQLDRMLATVEATAARQ